MKGSKHIRIVMENESGETIGVFVLRQPKANEIFKQNAERKRIKAAREAAGEKDLSLDEVEIFYTSFVARLVALENANPDELRDEDGPITLERIKEMDVSLAIIDQLVSLLNAVTNPSNPEAEEKNASASESSSDTKPS
jgi:hypothetical protein